MKLFLRLGMVGVAVLAGASAFAWNATGHRVIALIALDRLTPKARAEASRLLAAFPDRGEADFVGVSSWADETRTKENGRWHYKDIHFWDDGRVIETKSEEENAVWAIQKFRGVLGDRNRSDAERAEALRYLIHFVGDIHQPLHATARHTEEHPKGDRGGNEFFIESPDMFRDLPRPIRNLHALWDFGAGLYLPSDPGAAREIANQVTHDYPANHLREANDMDPEHWALESYATARKFVYSLKEHTVPSDNYLSTGRRVAEQRSALAGYRLATLVNRALG